MAKSKDQDGFSLKSQVLLSGIKPIFQWRGGKRKLVGRIAELIPTQFNDYYEPFVGGGAVFFAIGYLADKCHISDNNSDIINIYRQARDNPQKLINEHHKLTEDHSAISEYEKRRENFKRINDIWQQSEPVKSAAMLMVLLKLSINASITYRKDGKGMLSFDPRESSLYPNNRPNVLQASKLLQKTNVKTLDYSHIQPRKGDLVYIDPPYDCAYNRYSKTKSKEWTVDDTVTLRKTADKWLESGASVIASNNDTLLIRELYSDNFDIYEVELTRSQNVGTDDQPSKYGAAKSTELVMVSKCN